MAGTEPIPKWIKPMKAVSGELPRGDGWATELKWDGMRLHVQIDQGRISLRSSTGRDVTASFPELAPIAEAHPGRMILDGEAVVFDDNGDPSFGRLQHRMHATNPASSLLAEHPVVLVLFDLLWLDGLDATPLPFVERRRLLHEVVTEDPRWICPPYATEADQFYALARQRHLEGVVCKRLDSPYRPGRRSDDWVKVKVRREAEFVVGATLGGSGSLAGEIGSLAVGVFDDDGNLHLAGAVGSGLNEQFRSMLADRLVPRATSPFVETAKFGKPTQWVEPDCVVQVGYATWDEGAQLRHPTFLGIRTDKDPADVRRE